MAMQTIEELFEHELKDIYSAEHSLLDAYVMEKAIYELGYELGNRPAWAAIPLRGLIQLLSDEERRV